jgi:protein SCO1
MKNFIRYSIFVFGLVLAFSSCTSKPNVQKKVLPFLGNYDIEYNLIDGLEVADTIYPTIPFFYFLNEDSLVVKSTDLKGKIWVADFFFTTCSTICPKMTAQMKRLNVMTNDLSDNVQFISFSINPRYDQPAILKRYKEHHGIKAKNWVFLTGDEAETHRLGIENFMIAAGQDADALDGYAHSEAFTLVDKEGYVRGVYNISDPAQVDQMNKDIRKLLKYEYNIDRSGKD